MEFLNNATPNQLQAVSQIIKEFDSIRKYELQQHFQNAGVFEMVWGYNSQSGNVYCALDNGVTIAAPDYNPNNISYYVYCSEKGEQEFATYSNAFRFAAGEITVSSLQHYTL